MVMNTFRAFRIAINSDITAETNVGLSSHLWRMRAPVIVNPGVILFWISISFIIIIQIAFKWASVESSLHVYCYKLSIKMYDTNNSDRNRYCGGAAGDADTCSGAPCTSLHCVRPLKWGVFYSIVYIIIFK